MITWAKNSYIKVIHESFMYFADCAEYYTYKAKYNLYIWFFVLKTKFLLPWVEKDLTDWKYN